MIAITVYQRDPRDKKGHGHLYIQVDCLDWLLAYAADELYFQGVARVSPERPPITKRANCTAVADLSLQWEFVTKAWEAEFVSGPFAGSTRRFAVDDLTTARWAKLRDSGQVEGHAGRSVSIVMKEKAKEFIIRWCHAIASNGGDEFEEEWALAAHTYESPTKKRRDAVDPGTAVAAENATNN